MTLYKYSPINKFSISNLINEKKLFSDPNNFNDPFEFSIRDKLLFFENGKYRFLNKTQRGSIQSIIERDESIRQIIENLPCC